jgi:O-antigen ligase/tetratricopeptide (TPR) repeat protein
VKTEEGRSLVEWVGLGALLLALVLAPAIGGYPAGVTYGADISLNALRALVLVAAFCLMFGSRSLTLAPPDSGSRGILARCAAYALWASFGLTLLSLLVHSRFLTSPVLLFAMLPATLDWLCYALLFTLALALARDRRALPLLIGAFTVGAAWATIVGVLEYRSFAVQGLREQRVEGPFFSPNFLGGFLVLTLPIVTAWCLATKERLASLGLGILAALMVGTLVATGSRAGIALAGGGLVLALLLHLVTQRGQPLPWSRIGALLAAFAVLGFAFRGPITQRVQNRTQEQSVPFRTWTWKGTLDMAKANPVLGTGPGTFPSLYPRYALVARTDLAHSSYLQMAAEQGFPALLAAIVAIALTLYVAVASLFHWKTPKEVDSNSTVPLLLCALVGGLLASIGRNLFDSEWSLLGGAFPFWAVAGLTAGIALTPLTPLPAPRAVRSPDATAWGPRVVASAALLVALVFSFLLLSAAQKRAEAIQQGRTGMADRSLAAVWPPDSTLLFYTGQPDEAARIEPTGKRFYQLGRTYERGNDLTRAIAAFKRSSELDPNSLQTWRKLAETQEKAGDTAGALASWRELVLRYEGPAGRYRAIPELPDTYPAFAYAALARSTAAGGNRTEAAALFEKAARVIEDYSHTEPLYQQVEVETAQVNGLDVLAKRQEIRDLYGKVMSGWSEIDPAKAKELEQRRDETLARLDNFVRPEGVGGSAL